MHDCLNQSDLCPTVGLIGLRNSDQLAADVRRRSLHVCRSLDNTLRVTQCAPYEHLAVSNPPSLHPFSLQNSDLRCGGPAHTPIARYRKHAPLGVTASSLALADIPTFAACTSPCKRRYSLIYAFVVYLTALSVTEDKASGDAVKRLCDLI